MFLKVALGVAFIFLFVLGLWTYLIQKKSAYKFFFPAMVLFSFFSLIPIFYSVYVSFTNLKTGHLLDRQSVINLFLDEKILTENSKQIEYQLFKNQNKYLLVVDQFEAVFTDTDKSTYLEDKKNKTQNETTDFVKLSADQIIEFIESHQDFNVVHPSEGTLQFYRTEYLAKVTHRYLLNPQSEFVDQLTQEILIEDTLTGQFKSQNEAIGPGYFTFVGFKNYQDLLFDKELSFVFFKTFGWTISWAFLSVFLTFSFGAFLAVVLNDLTARSKLIYRLLFIIPYSIPFFISVLVFKGILNKDFGGLNSLLSLLKISPIPWLDHKMWARVSVLMVNLWLGFPYMLLVITGILQSIPKSIYEASSLEGATKFQNFRFLTFPLVLRSMVPLLIGAFAFNLNNFVGIYLLTGGGPAIANTSTPLGETDILISYTYRLAFEGSQGQNFAMASSVSMIIFIIVVSITLLNFKISKLYFQSKSLKHEN